MCEPSWIGGIAGFFPARLPKIGRTCGSLLSPRERPRRTSPSSETNPAPAGDAGSNAASPFEGGLAEGIVPKRRPLARI
jgi:hypothetical protein